MAHRTVACLLLALAKAANEERLPQNLLRILIYSTQGDRSLEKSEALHRISANGRTRNHNRLSTCNHPFEFAMG